MKTKTHISNLQKSSGLFMQLGLVLILFTVYLAFEHKTEERGLPIIERDFPPKEHENYVFPEEVQVERPKTKIVLNEPKTEKLQFRNLLTILKLQMIQRLMILTFHLKR